jgi:pimeloyl-ACP methyl ester carboxylesterase
MKEQFLDVNGWRTRFVTAGEKGPALVLLHGLGASWESWLLNINAFAQDYRVFAPDLLYFGKSAKPKTEPTNLDFVNFVLAFMDTLGISRASLIGNSMGGAIAANTAIQQPSRVEHLVLADPAGFGHELAWWLRLRTFVDFRSRGTPPPWMIRYGLSQIFYNPDCVPKEIVDAMVALNYEPGLFEAYRRVLNLGVGWRGLKPIMLQQIRDAAHQIRVPTLIVWGKQDQVIPVKHLQTAQEKIPHARAVVFDQCGHAPQIEQYEKFNTIVREFLCDA